MRTRHALLVLVWLAAALPAGALQPPQPAPPKVYGYASWNDTHFLFAARIESSIVSGTSTEEQVFPVGDDGIELSFDIPTAAGMPVRARLAVSAAGGFAVQTQDDTGRWRTDNSWLVPPAMLKFDTKVDGTLNDPSDTDRGYTVEVAIPWARLGGEPKPLGVIGFNFLVRIRGEGRGFVSWSPDVLSEEANAEPRNWGQLVLYPAPRPGQADRGVLACPKTLKLPLIDGTLAAPEWFGAAIITLEKPLPQVNPSPEGARRNEGLPLLMALYRYDFGGQAIAAWLQQPREGVGPWFSGDRPAWHRAQLREIQRTGIEVILPRYSVDPSARADTARRGLCALVAALREARAANRSYPLVGMYLDIAGVARLLGERADLTTPHGREVVYGAIREFFQHVPAEFRAEIEQAKGERGYPVVLGAPTGIAAWDDSFVSHANQAFARDFGGARLIWMADPAWKAHGLGDLCAYPSLTGDRPSAYDASGKAGVAVISPGYAESGGAVHPAGEGPEMREEWRRMLALQPGFLILNSWNDFPAGTALAPSRQQGLALTDTAALLVSAEAEETKLSVRLKKASPPAVVAPGARTGIELLLSNTSAAAIVSDQHVGLDMRLTDVAGKVTFATWRDIAPLRIPPGGSARVIVPFEARRDDRRSLPAGDYLLQFALRRSQLAYVKSSWFSRPLASFSVPVKVGRPADYALTLLGSTLPTQLQSGAGYSVALTLRNDGRRTWRAGEARIGYQWFRVTDEFAADSAGQRQALGEVSQGTPLAKDVAPGEISTVTVVLDAKAADKSLDVWRSGDLWHYELLWVLEADARHRAALPEGSGHAVYVFDDDIGVRFADSTTPRDMLAGRDYQVRVVVTNVGGATWRSGETPGAAALAYRWHFWDGTPSQWAGVADQVATPVKPGDSAQLSATVKAPPCAGSYHLAWELRQDDRASSATPNTSGDGMLVVPVAVREGPYQVVGLTPHLNVVAAASDRRRASADFDGMGNSLPLEALPPDLSGNPADLYPAGYYAPSAGERAATAVPFRYPEKNNGLSRAVASRGQTVSLPAGPCARLHLVGAGTGANLLGTVVVTFADGHTQAAPLRMSSWLESPTQGEAVAFSAPYLRSPRGDSARQPVYLHRYVITLSTPGQVTALTLPDNPDMKVFAITLEAPVEPE